MAVGQRIYLASVVAIVIAAVGSSAAIGRTRLQPPAGVERSAALDAYQEFVDRAATGSVDGALTVALVSCTEYQVAACLLPGKHGWYMKFYDGTYLRSPSFSPDEWLSTEILFDHEVAHFTDFRTAHRAAACRRAKQRRCPGGDLSYRKRFNALLENEGIAWRDVWPGRQEGDQSSEWWADAKALCDVFPGALPNRIVGEVYGTYGWDPTPAEHRAACRIARDAARANGWS